MSDPRLERVPSFLREVWALYGVGMAVLLLRFAIRFRTVGWRGMRWDDLFAFLLIIMYTCGTVTVDLVYRYGSNVEASAFQKQRVLSPEKINQFELGSKLQLTAWYSYTAILWCLKGTMLAFFRRVTTGLKHAKLVTWLAWTCGVSYIIVVLTLTFGCFPTRRNWQVVPDPGLKCTFRMQNFLVTVVLNILTDAGILCIPLPLLWTLQIPLRKKLVIGVLICSGFFVIAAAIIRVILTLGSSPSGTNINRWGVREILVGVISVNAPILRPLFTKKFWTGSAQTMHSSYYHTGGRSTIRKHGSRTLEEGNGPYEMAGSMKDGRIASEDTIIDRTGARSPVPNNEIRVLTTCHVETEQNSSHYAHDDWYNGGEVSTVVVSSKSAV